jgi:hypothetical protein
LELYAFGDNNEEIIDAGEFACPILSLWLKLTGGFKRITQVTTIKKI